VIRQGLVLQPKLVVADEPVSAVDVSMQSQVLNPLVDLKHDFNLSYLFVAHNLPWSLHLRPDRGHVFGKVVELATADEVFEKPLHPSELFGVRFMPAVTTS